MYDFIIDVLWKIAEVVYIVFWAMFVIAFLLFMIGAVILLAQNLYYFFRGKSSACCPGPSWFDEYRERNGL